MPSSKCIDLPWEGLALSSLPSLGNFLPWGLCLASLPLPQPQPCPTLGLPSSPRRWIHLWFPSSCFIWKSQRGAQVQSGPWASPPQPCLLLYTHPPSSIHATHSMAETVHIPASNPPRQPSSCKESPTLLQPCWDRVVCLSAPLAPLFPCPAWAPRSSTSMKPRKSYQVRLGPGPHSGHTALDVSLMNSSRAVTPNRG